MVKLRRSHHCELSLGFVDDLAAAGRNIENLRNTIVKIKEWTDENKMKLNEKKSAILFLQNTKMYNKKNTSEWIK